jgi:hypothetical protein
MLILLDLDGTLIHDRAYREAIDATTIRYATAMNLPVFAPYDEDIHVLHAHGYSNEWDLVAFLAGIRHRSKLLGDTVRPDYQAWTRKTAGVPGLPNERARDVLINESPAELHPLLHYLLDNVTDVENAPTTRMFAEMVLGSELFSQHYGLVSFLNTSSLLMALDEPLLNDAGRHVIKAHRCCIFTARPSFPPGHRMGQASSENNGPLVHPPEAEIGLRLLRLDHLPMIALGHVQWVADRYYERVYDLAKPGPVQALAAMLTASGIEEKTALIAGYRLWKTGKLPMEFRSINDEQVYVLEDNAAGVRACHTASSLLKHHGVDVTIHGLGISKAESKRAALAPVCDALFDDPNAALETIPN